MVIKSDAPPRGEELKFTPMWSRRDIRWQWEDGWTVQEVTTPWDLLAEMHFMGHSFGTPPHVFTVEKGEECIFSLRDEDDFPQATILAIPVGARDWWGHGVVRDLYTNSTFKMNDKEYHVTEVSTFGNKRVEGEVLRKVEDFFTGHGGVLNNNVPTGNILSGRELKDWRKRMEDKGDPRILLLAPTEDDVRRTGHYDFDFRVNDFDEALMALRFAGPWLRMFVPRDWERTTEVNDFVWRNQHLKPREIIRYFPKP